MSFGSTRQSDRWTAERPPQPDPHLDSWAARPQEPWAADPGPEKGRKGVAGGREPLGLISQKLGGSFKNWATPRWVKRPRQATGPQASRLQTPPDPSPYLRPFTPPHPPRVPPSPDLERKPGGGAWERPVREDELSPLEAAVRGPRPEPRPGAQEATHALREAHRLRAPRQKHPRRRHNAALGSLRPAPRPLVAQRASPRSLPPGGKDVPREI